MSKGKPAFPLSGVCLFICIASARGQAIPEAPSVPACSWGADGAHSTCKFKDALSGTPTSVVGKRVILFDYSKSGGHPISRLILRESLKRLAARYGFTAQATDDPAIFNPDTLSGTRAVIMSNGDGDVVAPGQNRSALEDFQQTYGWGVIWIHDACAFITSAWPFGQKSCVQQYFHHQSTGTKRRIFIDSGTAENTNQGRKNPQTAFLLQDLPGWGGNRSLEMANEWFCFQASPRATEGVNVLFGYDRSSGLPSPDCPEGTLASERASQNHNLAWTHMMGKGITLYNSWGHDSDTYTANGNMGDSLLWRYIRYAAKDWCVSGSGEPGCDAAPAALGPSRTVLQPGVAQRQGSVSVSLPDAGRYEVSLTDIGGRKWASRSGTGPAKVEIQGLGRGLYWMRVTRAGESRLQRVMMY